MSHPRTAMIGLFVISFCLPAPATAQPLGTLRWQLQPYCNVVTLNVALQGGLYTLDGTDDGCGAAQAASAVGLAFLNPSGTVGLGLSLVLPSGTPVHVEATLSMISLNGTWRDSAGNSGSFVFTPGAGIGGAPRPVAASGIAPASITSAAIAAGAVNSVHLAPNAVGSLQIEPGAVGSTQIAANAVTGAHVADGSLSVTDVANAPRVAFASGNQALSLPAFGYQTVRTVTLTATAAGQVIVNATGLFGFDSATVAETAVCYITRGAADDKAHEIYVSELSVAAMAYVPFGGTRGFPVVDGPVTINLVCQQLAGNVAVYDTSLTAIFVAQ